MNISAFNINESVIGNEIITKTTILSWISEIFELLDLSGPVFFYALLFIRYLWSIKLNWDEVVKNNLSDRWLKFEI